MTEQVIAQEFEPYSHMSAEVYDIIYAGKDYQAEAQALTEIIREYSKSSDATLLEAACGTGSYMQYLKDSFEVTGFDLSTQQVEGARKKVPGADLFVADMRNFETGHQYGVVVCLFSSIGYLQTQEALDEAIANFARHTVPGGVVIIEPWLKPENFTSGHISVESGSNEHLWVQRMGYSEQDGSISVVNMHHMIGTENGVEHMVEVHKLAMYSDNDFSRAFSAAGLEIDIDQAGLSSGRGLYIGTKPLETSHEN